MQLEGGIGRKVTWPLGQVPGYKRPMIRQILAHPRARARRLWGLVARRRRRLGRHRRRRHRRHRRRRRLGQRRRPGDAGRHELAANGFCGGVTCTGGTSCCVVGGTPSCMSSCPDGGLAAQCSKPSDCPNATDACCITIANYMPTTVMCTPGSMCAPTIMATGNGTDRACVTATDCTDNSGGTALPDCCTSTQSGQHVCFSKSLLTTVSAAAGHPTSAARKNRSLSPRRPCYCGGGQGGSMRGLAFVAVVSWSARSPSAEPLPVKHVEAVRVSVANKYAARARPARAAGRRRLAAPARRRRRLAPTSSTSRPARRRARSRSRSSAGPSVRRAPLRRRPRLPRAAPRRQAPAGASSTSTPTPRRSSCRRAGAAPPARPLRRRRGAAAADDGAPARIDKGAL